MAAEKRILIVDDAAVNIKLLKSLLSDDFKISIALNALKGFDIAKKIDTIHLALVDIMMPAIDGFGLCKMLKDDPATAHIPVVFVTATSKKEDIERAHSVGGVDFIIKPVIADMLFSCVEEHIL